MDVLIYLIQNTLPVMIPLLLVALGGMFSERSGVINLGIEGMMTIGAFVAAAVGLVAHNGWIAFLAGGIAGVRNNTIAATLTGCVNYGNVAGSTTGNGGILGLSESAATSTVANCVSIQLFNCKSPMEILAFFASYGFYEPYEGKKNSPVDSPSSLIPSAINSFCTTHSPTTPYFAVKESPFFASGV